MDDRLFYGITLLICTLLIISGSFLIHFYGTKETQFINDCGCPCTEPQDVVVNNESRYCFNRTELEEMVPDSRCKLCTFNVSEIGFVNGIYNHDGFYCELLKNKEEKTYVREHEVCHHLIALDNKSHFCHD